MALFLAAFAFAFASPALIHAMNLPEKPSNIAGRRLIVLAVPSVFDEYYKDKFEALFNFDMMLAKMALGYDNVIVVADKPTLPLVRKILPADCTLESSLSDIFLSDYAPIGVKSAVKFAYAPPNRDEVNRQQIESSFSRFLKEHFIELDHKTQSSLRLQGSQVVVNSAGTAIIDEVVIPQNDGVFQDWAALIQLRNTFGEIALIKPPTQVPSEPLFHLMNFVEPDLLVMNEMTPHFRNETMFAFKKAFKKFDSMRFLTLHDIHKPSEWRGTAASCGLYTSMLVTETSVYFPVFGNDPENWRKGYSSMMDRHAQQTVQVNTRKRMVPINVPNAVCEIGGSPISLAWQIEGTIADRLIQIARVKAKIAVEVAKQKKHKN